MSIKHNYLNWKIIWKHYNLKKKNDSEIKINNEKCVCIGISWDQMIITSK